MKLHVHELVTELRQVMKTPDRVTNIVAVRPHLYVHKQSLFTAEKVILSIENDRGLVAESEPVLVSDIPGEFFHGLIRFSLKAQLAANSVYSLVLKAQDYEFSETNWVGWCTDFDFKTYPADYDFSEALLLAPLRYEMWAKAQR